MERHTVDLKRTLSGVLATIVLFAVASPSRAQFNAPQTFAGTSGGTANAQTLSLPNITSYADIENVPIRFFVGLTNTGPATLNINGLGALPIKTPTGQGPTATLQGGELTAGNPETAITPDGVSFYVTVFNGNPVGPLIPLTGPLTYFVNSSTGNDSNSCLTTMLACATIQHALNLTQGFFLNGHNITINAAFPNAYQPFVASPINGVGGISIIGDTTTAAGTAATATIAAASGEATLFNGNGYTLTGFTVSSASDGVAPHLGCGVRADSANIILSHMSFGAASHAQVFADVNAYIQFLGVASGFPTDFVNITGSSPIFMESAQNSTISTGETNVHLVGTPAFSHAFAYAVNLSSILLPFNSVTGSATGSKYDADVLSVIDGTSAFPGTGGTTEAGGQAQ